MKVGIITFHDNYNFGAALQCASLNEVLRREGRKVEVIDYSVFNTQRSLLKGWGFRRYGPIRALKKRVSDLRFGQSTVQNFLRFRDRYWSLSPRCQTAEEVAELSERYTHVIAGSDQIWRFDRPGPYFLELGEGFEGVKATYAPCCTSSDQPSFQTAMVKEWLGEIDRLSVRNQFSYDLILELTGKKAAIVADPTLLIDLNDDNADLEKVDLPPEYILTYVIGSQPKGGMARVIRRAREVHGSVPVVAVRVTLDGFADAEWADLVLDGMGPFEWTQLIMRAKFFITDSFHGVIFAVKKGTPFLAYFAEEWRSPRLTDLRDRYLLGNRITNDLDQFPEEGYFEGRTPETVNAIAEHRESSMNYLTSIFRTA